MLPKNSIRKIFADEEMVITISHMGYIKRTRCPNIKCRTGEESDRKVQLHGMKTSWNIWLWPPCTIPCFSLQKRENVSGWKYTKYPKVKQSKGRALRIYWILNRTIKWKLIYQSAGFKRLWLYQQQLYRIVYQKGIIKKNNTGGLFTSRQNGVNAITIKEGDQLLEAKPMERMTSWLP